MTTISRETSKGQLVALDFTQDALAASQSNVQLSGTDVSQGGDGYTMPFAGQVVAVTADTTVAATAGSLTVGATVGGTEDADTTLTITTETAKRKVCPRGSASFVAGAKIGAEITTSGTWDGVTADLAVIVWVLLELDGV